MISEIRICPLKRLYQICAERELSGVALVISTSGDAPEVARLRGIPCVYALYRDIDYEGPGAFSDEAAARFAAFVKNRGPEITTLICVCDAAQSRSPAVAAAVGRFLELDMMDTVWRNPHYKPNMLVFEKMCAALGVPVTDGELDQYIYESNRAFRNAISRARNHSLQ